VPWGAASFAPFCYNRGVARNSLISLLAAQPLLRAEKTSARPLTGEVPGPTEGEAPFVADGYIQDGLLGGEPRCGFERTLEGEYCGEPGEVGLDGLWLCERHADRLRLQERVAYWRAILAHIDLWSGEARRKGRGTSWPSSGSRGRGRLRPWSVLAQPYSETETAQTAK